MSRAVYVLVYVLVFAATVLLAACRTEDDAPAQEVQQDPTPEKHPFVDTLSRIVIPRVDISDASIEEAFDYARVLSLTHDPEKDPARKGISMMVERPRREGESLDDGLGGPDSTQTPTPKITYSGVDVTLLDLVAEIASQAELDAYMTSVGIMIVPEGCPPFPNGKADEGEVWAVLRQVGHEQSEAAGADH